MSVRASGHHACCGEATGRWSIWREVMQNGLLPLKPCWLICHRRKRQIFSAVTRRASISQAEDDGHLEDDWLPTCGSLLASVCGQTTDNVALWGDSDDHERSDRSSR